MNKKLKEVFSRFESKNDDTKRLKEYKETKKLVDITEPGSLISLKAINNRRELAMVLHHVTNDDLKSYVELNKIKHDEDPRWDSSYSVLGTYHYDDINEKIINNSEESPTLNIIIVKVINKNKYQIITDTSEDSMLLMNSIKNISSADEEVVDRCNELLKTTVVNMISGDMSRTYLNNKNSGSTDN